MPETRAIILCHGADAGLSGIRALSRHGVPVVAICFDDNVAAFSRLPQRSLQVPGDSLVEKLAQLRILLQEIPTPDRPVLLPSSDILLDFVCDNRSELEGRFSLLMPSSHTIRTLNDKAEETAWVTGLRFPLPKTIAPLPSSSAELLDVLRLPIMVKLRKHEYWSVLGSKNVILRSRIEVEQFYEKKHAWTNLLVGQELIEADDSASWLCNAVFDRTHRLISTCIKHKIRMSPAHFGSATIAVSAANAAVRGLAERLGAQMRLVGLASFEFRQDPRDGEYRYIENNPRLAGGCSGVDYDFHIGVPTAWIFYRLVLGLPLTDTGRQKDGVVFHDCVKDLRTRVHNGESASAILRHHAALHWQHAIRRPCASWSDPLPGAVAFARYLCNRPDDVAPTYSPAKKLAAASYS